MGISFPADVEELNETDLDVLRCLHGSGALWKLEATRRINRLRGEEEMLVERKESITKQAVSRRVERLHSLGYLETSIISPSRSEGEIKPDRDFIEGYGLSEKGEKALEEIVRKVLRDAVAESIDGDRPEAVDRYLELYSELTGHPVDSLVEFVELETKN